jgi:branched-chain amino acid transport system permease protein
MLETFLQTLLDAVAVGSLYALIALGYTMVYGILKFINFAHSDVFVLGAWISFAAATSIGWGATGAAPGSAPWVWFGLWAITIAAGLAVAIEFAFARASTSLQGPWSFRSFLQSSRYAGTLSIMAVWAWLAIALLYAAKLTLTSESTKLLSGGLILLCAMLTCGLVGFTLERVAYKPLRKAPRLNVLITAIGVSLLLQNTGQLEHMFGTRPTRMPGLLPDKVLASIGGGANASPVEVHLVDVIGAGTALLLMLALDRLVFRTKMGAAMRAVSFNEKTAALMGIPVDRVISFTFVLGAMLAAAAGFLYAMKYPGLNQTAAPVWTLLGLKAFVAAVVGGIGNIRGAMLGGLLIGLIEFFGAKYLSTDFRDVYVFGLLIVVLLVRPTGILGKPISDKV